MKRLALLIGSQTGTLSGVHGDVARMQAALSASFAVTSLIEERASRDGILKAYTQLIDDADEGDAVCIYYSGHGNRVENPDFAPGNGQPQVLQYIIPTDDGPEDFRGIMSFELSALQAKFKTKNVTVILDCCHAGRMSREATALLPKRGEPRVTPQQVRELLAKTKDLAALVDAESNPNVVRLVATEAETLAYEHTAALGRTGVLTEAFLLALAEAGSEAVPWTVLGLRVRELVMKSVSVQRPEVEGPRARLLWSTSEATGEKPLAFFFRGQEPRLRAGRLLGAVPGAEYGIMPAGSQAIVENALLARATVIENVGSQSRVRLDDQAAGATLQDGLPAFPLRVPFERYPVLLDADVPDELRTELAKSRYLAVDAVADGEKPCRIAREGDRLILIDPLGDVLQDETLQHVLSKSLPLFKLRLELVARAERFRHWDTGALRCKLKLEFGRIAGNQRIIIPEGDTVHVADQIYVSVENVGYGECQAAVFNIDAGYVISLLSEQAPQGYLLSHDDPRLYVGLGGDGGFVGLPARFPDGLSKHPENPNDPSDRTRRESLIVVAADDKQDFQLLTTGQSKRGGQRSTLEGRFAGLRGGSARDAQQTERATEYMLLRFDYRLSPEPRSGG